jgi:hypothetical protein
MVSNFTTKPCFFFAIAYCNMQLMMQKVVSPDLVSYLIFFVFYPEPGMWLVGILNSLSFTWIANNFINFCVF